MAISSAAPRIRWTQGFIRLWVVASVLWAIFIVVWLLNLFNSELNVALTACDYLLDGESAEGWFDCQRPIIEEYKERHWRGFVEIRWLTIVIPIAFAFPLFVALGQVAKWVAHGFCSDAR